MSHAVEPDGLAEAAEPYGQTPYLLYSSDHGAARANHVRAVLEMDSPVVRITGFGRSVIKAVERDAPLSLLWPSRGAGEFSLIADGMGTILDENNVEITITSAVLHRPAPVGEGNSTC